MVSKLGYIDLSLYFCGQIPMRHHDENKVSDMGIVRDDGIAGRYQHCRHTAKRLVQS